jgi:hypothetical protein
MIRFRTVVTPLMLLSALAAQEKVQADTFHARIRALYAFAPHELTQAQVEAKAKELDDFWRLATRDPAASLPLLRAELADPGNGRFFAYDGAKLLLQMSKDPADRQLAAVSIARVDLRDVDHADYLRTLHTLALQGADVRAGAALILDTPAFKATIPQHALTLGQNYSFICLAFQQDEAVLLPTLLERLAKEQDATTQKTLLQALWYTALPGARTALEAFAADPLRLESTRAFARVLLKRPFPKALDETSAAIRSLRSQRRACLARISDEGLMDFDRLTLELAKH